MIKIHCDQGTASWHELRAGRITGTKFKALMAEGSTKTYKDLILDLVGELIGGDKEESYSNSDMERGIELEPKAREFYSEHMDEEVDECGFVIPDEDNPFHEWIGVSPDGITEGLLEIKCPKKKTHLGYILKGKLPTEYRHQVQGQLFVTGLPYSDFMSYYPGMKPFIIRVEPDLELHEQYKLKIAQAIEEVKLIISQYKNFMSNE